MPPTTSHQVPDLRKLVDGMTNFWQDSKDWRRSDRNYIQDFRLSHCNNISRSLKLAQQGHRQANKAAIVLGDLAQCPGQDIVKAMLRVERMRDNIEKMHHALYDDRDTLHHVKVRLSSELEAIKMQKHSISVAKVSSENWSKFYGMMSFLADKACHVDWCEQNGISTAPLLILFVSSLFILGSSHLQDNADAKVREYANQKQTCDATMREIENMINICNSFDAYLGRLIQFWKDVHKSWSEILNCLEGGAEYGSITRRFEITRDTLRSYEEEVGRLADQLLIPTPEY